jgi:hypothetical protein
MVPDCQARWGKESPSSYNPTRCLRGLDPGLGFFFYYGNTKEEAKPRLKSGATVVGSKGRTR